MHTYDLIGTDHVEAGFEKTVEPKKNKETIVTQTWTLGVSPPPLPPPP